VAEWEGVKANWDLALLICLWEQLPQWLAGGKEDYFIEWDNQSWWMRIFTSRQDVSDLDLQAIGEGHGALIVTADKYQIAADGVDTATIFCQDGKIAADTEIDYTVKWWNETVSVNGAQDGVVAGEVHLELATSRAGFYLVELRRVAGYETGYVMVEAV
jgi:hypothetical protein